MKNAQTQNSISLVLALWTFLCPWIFSLNLASTVKTVAVWNSWIIGTVVFASTVLALQKLRPWQEWLNLALGLWLALSPWILSYSTEAQFALNNALVGIAIAALSGFSIPEANKLKEQM
jgi:hypothetical protein